MVKHEHKLFKGANLRIIDNIIEVDFKNIDK